MTKHLSCCGRGAAAAPVWTDQERLGVKMRYLGRLGHRILTGEAKTTGSAMSLRIPGGEHVKRADFQSGPARGMLEI